MRLTETLSRMNLRAGTTLPQASKRPVRRDPTYWGLRHLITGDIIVQRVELFSLGRPRPVTMERTLARADWCSARDARESLRLDEHCRLDRLTPAEMRVHLSLEASLAAFIAISDKTDGEVMEYVHVLDEREQDSAKPDPRRHDCRLGAAGMAAGGTCCVLTSAAFGVAVLPALLIAWGAGLAVLGGVVWHQGRQQGEGREQGGDSCRV